MQQGNEALADFTFRKATGASQRILTYGNLNLGRSRLS
jgi:hypothetical protein